MRLTSISKNISRLTKTLNDLNVSNKARYKSMEPEVPKIIEMLKESKKGYLYQTIGKDGKRGDYCWIDNDGKFNIRIKV